VNAVRFFAIAFALCIVTAHAQVAPATRDEVAHLLSHLGQSGCEFFRNGSWYDAKQAQEHLQTKYDYLLRKNLVETAEDFIKRAGTESSMSGKPYQVRCPGEAPTASAIWLTQELKHYRARQK
jgi:hypothetical protein